MNTRNRRAGVWLLIFSFFVCPSFTQANAGQQVIEEAQSDDGNLVTLTFSIFPQQSASKLARL